MDFILLPAAAAVTTTADVTRSYENLLVITYFKFLWAKQKSSVIVISTTVRIIFRILVTHQPKWDDERKETKLCITVHSIESIYSLVIRHPKTQKLWFGENLRMKTYYFLYIMCRWFILWEFCTAIILGVIRRRWKGRRIGEGNSREQLENKALSTWSRECCCEELNTPSPAAD